VAPEAAESASGAVGEPGPEAATRRVDKPWGHELIWADTDRYAGKILVIETGKRLSLQVHEQKDESILILSGRLRFHHGPAGDRLETTELGPGDHRRIPVGMVHRFEAIERCELIEVSTPELDDVIRIEDDFGREGTSAP
jgi:mannose-6-phosphate isomerase-like protein (cupin superfamily)